MIGLCRVAVLSSVFFVSAVTAIAADVPATGAAFDRAAYRGLTTTNAYTPLTSATYQAVPLHVGPVPAGLRREYDIGPFYTKSVTVRGVPIIASDKASDFAVLEAAYQIDHLLAGSPAWVIDAITKAKVRLGVMAVVEYTTDVPEHADEEMTRGDRGAFWDKRARGLGGLPLATCAEENLLNLPSDPYRGENIALHEFAHTVASAIKDARPAWYAELEKTYQRAMKDGLFAKSYAANNEQEYWAEGVQDWFDCNANVKNAVHNGVWTRDGLKAYDPRLAALIAGVFGDDAWRYRPTTDVWSKAGHHLVARPPAEADHLEGLDRTRLPAYDVKNSPRVRAFPDAK